MWEKRKMNIVLIGARCNGKTTVGKVLSARTGKVFLDTDTLVEEKAGSAIEALIASGGWEAFRDLEKQAVSSYPKGTTRSLPRAAEWSWMRLT